MSERHQYRNTHVYIPSPVVSGNTTHPVIGRPRQIYVYKIPTNNRHSLYIVYTHKGTRTRIPNDTINDRIVSNTVEMNKNLSAGNNNER